MVLTPPYRENTANGHFCFTFFKIFMRAFGQELPVKPEPVKLRRAFNVRAPGFPFTDSGRRCHLLLIWLQLFRCQMNHRVIESGRTNQSYHFRNSTEEKI
jgi:hypothetical protein